MRPLPVVRGPDAPASPPGESARAARRGLDVAATDGVAFRDPPPVAQAATPLELAIARVLVGAPSLPVELKAFRLTLLAVEVDKRGIDLVVGPSDPMARLRLSRDKGAEAVSVAVEETTPEARRWSRVLGVMAERVRAATTPSKWDEAWAIARDLAKLPTGVPLGFFRQL